MTGPQGMGPMVPAYEVLVGGDSAYDDIINGLVGTMWYSKVAELAGSELDQDPMGGTATIYNEGGFRYFEFLADDYFFTGKSDSVSAEVMSIGGGGGGARGNGNVVPYITWFGGGGGSGQMTIDSVSIVDGITIANVGPGGAAQSAARGSTGSATNFGSLTSAAGGYGGGSWETASGAGGSGSGTGGSGGGGAQGSGTTPAAWAPGGAAGAAFSGAGGTASTVNIAAGGGGAGGNATNGSTFATGADGGPGKEYPTGSGRYYGGGGRGGTASAGGDPGIGQAVGGGGNGGRNSSLPSAGTPGGIVVRVVP